MAAGVVGDLYMRDARQQPLEGRGDLALHALRVVDVVLQRGVGSADLVEQVDDLRAAAEHEAGHVVGVDRLDQQAAAGARELGGGPAQVGDQGRAQPGGVDAGGRAAGQQVELPDVERVGVGQRLRDTGAELGDPPRVAGDAALARGPVAGRQVVQHRAQAAAGQPRTDLGGRVRVRKLELDRREARARRALEALEEADLGVEQRQVGGQARQDRAPLRHRRGAGSRWVCSRWRHGRRG